MKIWFLVHCIGGLIQDFQKVSSKKMAIEFAETIWDSPTCDPEGDDLKVFDWDGNVVWQPPKEG